MNDNQKAVTARCFTTGYNGRSLKLLNEVIIATEKGNLKATALWDTHSSLLGCLLCQMQILFIIRLVIFKTRL